jgi:hypothetical protein
MPQIEETETVTEQARPTRFTFGESTMKAVIDLYRSDSLRESPRWKSAFPELDRSISTFTSGVGFFGSVENAGKTNWLQTYYLGILDNTPGSIVVDCILDDSRDQRIRTIAANLARLSVQDISIPGMIPEGDPRHGQRKRAFEQIILNYDKRLALIDNTCLSGKGGQLAHLLQFLGDMRHDNPEAPIWVNVDAFDDLQVPGIDGENDFIAHASGALKTASVQHDLAIMCSKHMNKGEGRNAKTDALRGAGRLKYDASVILMGYNDVAENGQNAEIYFNRDDEAYGEKAPVFEVSVRKNKAGGFRGTLCYRQFPEMYACEELSSLDQVDYRQQIQQQVTQARSQRERRGGSN